MPRPCVGLVVRRSESHPSSDGMTDAAQYDPVELKVSNFGSLFIESKIIDFCQVIFYFSLTRVM